MNIILFGPPGAGKGTQSDFLVSKFQLFKLSTGDLLRNEISKKTELGKKIENIVNAGKLVSNDIIDSLIESIVSNPQYLNKIIFDGYPRNLEQAQSLDKLLKKFNQKIHLVLSLEVSLQSVIKRITGRAICKKCGKIYNEFFNPPPTNTDCCKGDNLQKRKDDNEKVVTSRYETYQNLTEPILKHYEGSGIVKKLDGNLEIKQIMGQISKYIEGLRG